MKGHKKQNQSKDFENKKIEMKEKMKKLTRTMHVFLIYPIKNQR
jgi:hypothetical protein